MVFLVKVRAEPALTTPNANPTSPVVVADRVMSLLFCKLATAMSATTLAAVPADADAALATVPPKPVALVPAKLTWLVATLPRLVNAKEPVTAPPSSNTLPVATLVTSADSTTWREATPAEAALSSPTFSATRLVALLAPE